jgi:CheY-like chemotaxis protein/CheY-specific phosphatase CheX
MNITISEQDLKTYVNESVVAAFETVLSMYIEPSKSEPPIKNNEAHVIGMVGIAGKKRGVVCLKVGEVFSHVVTAAMFGLDTDAAQSASDVTDVIGELTNIIAGKLNFCLRSENETYILSLPTVIRGHSIDLESISGVVHHRFAFTYASHSIIIELYSVREKDQKNMNATKILLVDDSKATRSVIAKVFSPYNCEIIEAPNGAIGLEMARMHQPSLMILDMTMPVMNGVETLDRLRADPSTNNMPVIMLSASSNPEEMQLMKAKGVVHYITKTQRPSLILKCALDVIKLEPQSNAA